jgi:predicted CXXCH cytochrome family protein
VQAADQEIAGTSTVMVPANGTTIGDLLYGATRTMECVTCHDVHNTANQPGAERFLWRSDNKSNFCLTCHLK